MAEDEELVSEQGESEDDSDSDNPGTDSDEASGNEKAAGDSKTTAKRGRPSKEPPPPKLWRLEGTSPEGMRVTLGRYVNREEAEPDLERLKEDGFYAKLKITKSKED